MNLDKYKCDYYRMTGEKYKISVKTVWKFLCFHNLRYVFWYRKYEKNHGVIARIAMLKMARKYGLEISCKSQIGEGLYLGHPYNITIAEDVVIEKNCNLHKGCTIGRTNRGQNIGVPTIGDNVYIGINASIVGKINIGSDVLIAPNSYVNFDVPDHTIVVGNPGVMHDKENATYSYVNYKI